MKETLKESGYTFIDWADSQTAILRDEDGGYELWAKNDGHASYGIVIDRHDYEFVSNVTELQLAQLGVKV